MAKIATALIVLAVGLGGCAGLRRPVDDSASPSAAIPDRLDAVSGRWQGKMDETAGWFHQGSTPIDLTIASDGSWSGTLGKAKAVGVVEFKGRDMVLDGTARSPLGHEDAVNLRLTGDSGRRWGSTVTQFDGRSERAVASLANAD
jgi:hypothetical protein